MNLPSRDERAWLDDHVEAYLDGELRASELAEFERLRSMNPDVEAELEAALRIRNALRGFEQFELPAAVAGRVAVWRRRQVLSEAAGRVRDLLRVELPRLWRPVAAMAVLGALVVAVSVVGRQEPAASYSSTDVQQALVEARWAIDYIADMGRTTGRPVRVSLLDEGVRAPVNKAINSIIYTNEESGSDE